MQVTARLSGELVQQMGRARLPVSLPDGATVAVLMQQLRDTYPQSARTLQAAVPIIAGRHVSTEQVLEGGQEVAILLPIAGG